MSEPENPIVHRIEIDPGLPPEFASAIADSLTAAFTELGFSVEAGAKGSHSPDLEVRDADGHTVAVVDVKAPQRNRIEEAQDTLQEIRKRNETTGKRLDSLRKRLAIA
jgi:hypothetical protein